VAARQHENGSRGVHGAAERVAPADGDSPGPALVRDQLERILGSSEFIGSDRTRRFLRYVVEETLAGRGDRIKAYSVAVAAFDRDESFDPQTDPIVRIEAGRLRRSLERYYLVVGATDPVRIQIPRGAYVPNFTFLNVQGSASGPSEDDPAHASMPTGEVFTPPRPRRAIRSPGPILALVAVLALVAGLAVLLMSLGSFREAPPVRKPVLPHPSLAILPFDISSSEQSAARLATGMTNEVVRELSRFSSVFVLGPDSLQRFGAAPDVTLIGADAGVDFVLSGDILVASGRFQVSVQLSDAETGGIVWAERYDRSFTIDRMFDVEVEIARDIVRQIGQPQGAIALFDWKRTRGMAPEAWEAYDCIVQADELHRRILPPSQAPEVLACLNRVVEQEPGYADGWVMLALIEIDEFRFVPLTLLPAGSLDRAYAAAVRAVDLAPDSGRAHLAMMMALFFRGQVEPALAAGQVAVQLTPHDPDILAEVGNRNVLSGDVNLGMTLLEQAMQTAQSIPAAYQLSLSLGYLRIGSYQRASDAIAALGASPNFVYWSVLAAAHGKAGRLDKAREAAGELLKLYPDFPRWAGAELERRSLAPELAAALVDGWRAAGLDIQPLPGTGSTP